MFKVISDIMAHSYEMLLQLVSALERMDLCIDVYHKQSL